MNRPTFQQVYMRFAHDLANRGTCARLKVDCVITSTDSRYVYAIGYNGNASRLPNSCDSETPGACGCLHAEENAIINCNTPRDVMKLVYCTHSPCVMCAKRLINLGGVALVHYQVDYRDKQPLKLLKQAGIATESV